MLYELCCCLVLCRILFSLLLMKVIVASFPKCGTKTLHACLEQLGYIVYDYDLNLLHFGSEWTKILTYGSTPGQFQQMYDSIDSVCDMPACYYWEELHHDFPDAKIILTMKESEEKWLESWNRQENKNKIKLSQLLWMLSSTARNVSNLGRLLGRVVFGCPPQSMFTMLEQPNDELKKRRYRDHNTSVLTRAPKDKLLIFKLSDGWKPLCDFLDKEVPATPFPHENIHASVNDAFRYTPLYKTIQKEVHHALTVLAICSGISLAFICYSVNFGFW